MSDDSVARTPPAAPLSEDAGYDAIHETIAATERGRWFLEEYVRRHRGADTEQVLAAIARIEQVLHGGSAADATGQGEIAAMLATIEQARRDLVGRGDLAASGEAAIADFRNAAEQIQQMVLGAHGPDSDLGQQLSFQTNRLAGAGERLERSIAGLRPLLALLEDLEQGLYRLVSGPQPDAVELPPRPTAAPQAQTPIEWSQPAAEDEPPEPEPLLDAFELDEAKPVAEHADLARPRPDTEAFWDFTEVDPGTAREEAVEEAESEASITDWAFALADAERAPDATGTLLPSEATAPPEHPPVAALEQLEAREYGRRVAATGLDALLLAEPAAAHTPPPDLAWATEAPAVEPSPIQEWTVEPAIADVPPPDLVWGGEAGATTEQPSTDPVPDVSPPALRQSGPAIEDPIGWGGPAPSASEPTVNSDLFDSGEFAAARPELPVQPADDDARQHEDAIEPGPDRSASFLDETTAGPAADEAPPAGATNEQADYRSQDRLPPLSLGPDRTTADAPQPPAPESGVDMPSVLQRLESMRAAIAALMDEVSQKRPGDGPRRNRRDGPVGSGH